MSGQSQGSSRLPVGRTGRGLALQSQRTPLPRLRKPTAQCACLPVAAILSLLELAGFNDYVNSKSGPLPAAELPRRYGRGLFRSPLPAACFAPVSSSPLANPRGSKPRSGGSYKSGGQGRRGNSLVWRKSSRRVVNRIHRPGHSLTDLHQQPGRRVPDMFWRQQRGRLPLRGALAAPNAL